MRGWLKLGILLIICIASQIIFAGKTKTLKSATYSSENLIQELNRIVKEQGQDAAISIQIKSMKYGDTLYAKNAYSLLTPASILKILTAESALLYLGLEYKFPTTLMTDATAMNNGLIKGNLYFILTGDPTLTFTDLTDLMTALKSQDIRGITGNVFIDTSAYDNHNLGPGWIWDDTRYCYSAPISASIINHNCLFFKITPGKKPGQTATILPNTHYYYGTIQNEVITKASKARSCNIQLGQNQNAIELKGCMPKGNYAWGMSVVISNIKEYNQSLLTYLFKHSNFKVAGHISEGNAPTHLYSIAIHESKPLTTLIKEMLKKSDNLIAGSLFKKMGEFYARQPGSWKNGGDAVKQILIQEASVNANNMILIDGSGLSRKNQVTAAQLIQVLDFAFHDNRTHDAFISALPIAGIDGTLKHRLGNLTRKVHAKTGTMAASGVVSLAGYVTTNKQKEPLAFVIMVNGRPGSVWKYREMEDKIVTALANFTRS